MYVNKKKTKKINPESKKIFLDFLKTNNSFVFKDDLSYEYYKIRTAKVNEDTNDFFIDRVLCLTIDKISNYAVFYDFISYCIKNNHHNIALEQAIIKTPKSNDFLYSLHLKSMVSLFNNEQNLLLKFINRKIFLVSAWMWLDELLNSVQSEQHKLKVFNTLFSSSLFNNTDNQKEIYVVFKKHIKTHLKFANKFDRLVQKQDELISSKNETSFSLSFNKENLIRANLNNHLGGDSLISYINEHCNYIAKNFLNLNITEVIMTYNKESSQHILHIFCPNEFIELNKHIFYSVINLIITSDNSEKVIQLIDNYDEFIQKETSIFISRNLRSDLDVNKDKKERIIKI